MNYDEDLPLWVVIVAALAMIAGVWIAVLATG